MLRKIFVHELRLLSRDKIVWITFVCFGIAIGYSVLSRSVEVQKQRENVKEWPAIFDRNVEKYKEAAHQLEVKIESGEMQNDPLAYDARSARFVVSYLRATVALSPSPLSVLAVGRSDLDSLAYVIEVFGAVEPRREPTDYPLRSLMGHFDLAFVMMFLYPLFIIGLSFNLVSSEKETGTLALVLSQPLSIRTLVLGKVLARAFVIFGLTILFTLLALALSGAKFTNPSVISGLLLWLTAVTAYGSIWFGLALIVNHYMTSSASCALTLMIGWFVLTIFFPSLINLATNLLYPVPSRLELIDARRATSLDVSKDSDEDRNVKGFLADHPEFPADRSYSKPARGWMATGFIQAETARRLQRLNERFDRQLNHQQTVVSFLSPISPQTVMQSLLPEIAGTGRLRHGSFVKHITQTQADLQSFLWPRIFFDQPMASSDYDLIPRYRYQEPSSELIRESVRPISLLFLQALVVLFFGLRLFAKRPA